MQPQLPDLPQRLPNSSIVTVADNAVQSGLIPMQAETMYVTIAAPDADGSNGTFTSRTVVVFPPEFRYN